MSEEKIRTYSELSFETMLDEKIIYVRTSIRMKQIQEIIRLLRSTTDFQNHILAQQLEYNIALFKQKVVEIKEQTILQDRVVRFHEYDDKFGGLFYEQ